MMMMMMITTTTTMMMMTTTMMMMTMTMMMMMTTTTMVMMMKTMVMMMKTIPMNELFFIENTDFATPTEKSKLKKSIRTEDEQVVKAIIGIDITNVSELQSSVAVVRQWWWWCWWWIRRRRRRHHSDGYDEKAVFVKKDPCLRSFQAWIWVSQMKHTDTY